MSEEIKQFPEINQVFTMSTSHMTLSDNRELKHYADLSTCHQVSHTSAGYIIRAYGLKQDVRSENGLPDWTEFLSAKLVDLLIKAADAGAYLIEFDQDAPTVDGAMQFDW